MPSQFSKFLLDETCQQYWHPWTQSCSNAIAGLGLHAVQESFKIYLALYTVTLLMKGKIPTREDLRKTVISILQSTAFLSWTGFMYAMFLCGMRRTLGHFNILTVSFLPSFFANVLALMIERPSRHILLCLYVSNIATETLFRMGVARGYYTAIPRGETYIFAVSITFLLYLYRSKTNMKDTICTILRFVIGEYESKEHAKNKRLHSNVPTHFTSEGQRSNAKRAHKKLQQKDMNIVMKSFEEYKKIVKYLKTQRTQTSCLHPYSCTHYVLTGGIKLFSCGLGAQVVLDLVFQFRKIFMKPYLLKAVIFKKSNLKLGLFLGGFSALYRLVSCSLRSIFRKDSEYYAIPAGLVASTAFMAYPGNTIALYFMWKALQLLCNDFVERGIIPKVKWFMVLLYCFNTAVLFHAAIVEPLRLRPSYWTFLYRLSGGRIASISREPLEIFGLGSKRQLEIVLKKTNTTDKHLYLF